MIWITYFRRLPSDQINVIPKMSLPISYSGRLDR